MYIMKRYIRVKINILYYLSKNLSKCFFIIYIEIVEELKLILYIV